MRDETRSRSSTARIDRIAVALNIEMTMLAMGGIMTRNACGKTTFAHIGIQCRPSARAASHCPFSTELMPARAASLK